MEKTLAMFALAVCKQKSLSPFLEIENIYDFLPNRAKEILLNIPTLNQAGNFKDLKDGMKNYKTFIFECVKICIDKIKKGCPHEKKFDSIGFDEITHDSPNALGLYAKEDNSSAIGFDDLFVSRIIILLMAGTYYFYRFGEIEKSSKKDIVDNIRQFILTAEIFSRAWYGGEESNPNQFAEHLDELFINMKIFFDKSNVFSSYEDFFEYFQLHVHVRALAFFIAHEMGHIKLNHSGPVHFNALPYEKAEISTFQHDKEFEADKWALFTLASLEKESHNKLLLSKIPSLFFSAVSLFESFHQPITVLGKHISKTHPPAKERAKILSTLSGKLHKDNYDPSITYDKNFFEGLTNFFLNATEIIKQCKTLRNGGMGSPIND